MLHVLVEWIISQCNDQKINLWYDEVKICKKKPDSNAPTEKVQPWRRDKNKRTNFPMSLKNPAECSALIDDRYR